MRRKKTIVIVVIVLVGLLALMWLESLPLRKRQTEIDVNSGRLRKRAFLFGLTVSEEVIETPFSRLVAKHAGDVGPARYETARIVTLGILPVVQGYECYRLGGALGDMRLLPKMLETWPSLRVKEREIVMRMLVLLQQGKMKEMHRYLRELMPEDNAQ